MKNFIVAVIALVSISHACCEDAMTIARFKKIVSSKGDQIAMRQELAAIPIWRNAKCGITMKSEDFFSEVGVGSYSVKGVSDRILIFKDGKLITTRETSVISEENNAPKNETKSPQ